MVVYADMLFAINFSMDFISLFITVTLMHRKINKKRILISSAIGGLYGVFDVLCPVNIIVGIIINIVVSFLMCFVSYYEKSIKRFLAMYIIYWGVSATLAGFMSIFYSLLNKLLSEYILDYSYSEVYNGARFFIIASLAMIIAVIFGRAFSKEKNIKYVEIVVKIKTDIYKINALCDSGNLLTDPLSGKSVILVSKESVLGKAIDDIPDIYKKYIPYNSAGASGILKGIVPSSINIAGREIDAIIAPSENKSFAGYEGCISYSLV